MEDNLYLLPMLGMMKWDRFLLLLWYDRLVLFEEEVYEKKEPVMVFKRTDLISYSFEEDEIDNNEFVKRFIKKCNEGGIEYVKSK